MRELAKKVGSLALAVGALTLVLFNAALNHGCASSQPAARAEPGRDDLRPPSPGAGSERAKAVAPTASMAPSLRDVDGSGPGLAGDEDCDPSYMYATKAPVIRVGNCRGGGQAANPGAKSAVDPSNAQQQTR